MSGEEGVSVCLRVAEAKQQRDVGRGIARIGSNAMNTIGVTVGDVVEIQGEKATPAKVWPAYPEDQEVGLIRIDGFIRKNCGVSLNEYVTIRKAEVEKAISVKLAPVDIRISVDPDFLRFVKDRLIDRPVIRGDTILIMMLGHSVPFLVVNTRPSGIVRISSNTVVNILSMPVPVEYEDRKQLYEDRKHLRFRCLKWVEAMYAADETWFYIPGRDERNKDETAIIQAARETASEEEKIVEVRVELLEKRGSIEPEGFLWAEVDPKGEIRYTYPERWLKEILTLNAYKRRYYPPSSL